MGAELVVLSACRTGGSRAELSLGAGLTRGFLAAGVSALLVSLWRVDDEGTTAFMEMFYSALRSGRPIDEALRRTALARRASGAHPADWGSFQLIQRSVTNLGRAW